MGDNEILSMMVKGRESCRQLVQMYENNRGNNDSAAGESTADMRTLSDADRAATRLLTFLKDLPPQPGEMMTDGTNRDHAVKLMGDIGSLLERAMMLEREFRNTFAAVPQRESSARRMPVQNRQANAYRKWA